MCEQLDPEIHLKQQRDDLQLLNQVMRHDIRNDLQLVEAYAELLEDHVDDEGVEYLEIIKENAESAVTMTTTVRDLAQVMLRDDATPERVQLDQILSHQIEEIRSSYADAVVTVSGSLPSTTVFGDEMLGSVFRNILRNAVQHNDSTPPTIDVSTTVEESAAAVEVAIADNGPGVRAEIREEIFGKGEKGLDSPGAGIGLYLVRSLVEGYGGDVWVESNDPRGAVFVVRLRLAT